MLDRTPSATPIKQQYWNELTDLKGDAAYIRLYLDSLGRWVAALGTLKAVASSAGIAAWVIWREFEFVWGAIIAASQLADALKEVFPFVRRHKAACDYAMKLDNLFIDVQFEWENIDSGRHSAIEVRKRLHQLRKLRKETEQRYFPDGLATREDFKVQARQEVGEYFKSTYGVK
jgi:hypothetical protein